MELLHSHRRIKRKQTFPYSGACGTDRCGRRIAVSSSIDTAQHFEIAGAQRTHGFHQGQSFTWNENAFEKMLHPFASESASRMRPLAAAVSSPSEYAKAPTGKKESVNCKAADE